MKNNRSLMFKLMIWINAISVVTMVALSASIMFNVVKNTEKTIEQEMEDLAASVKIASTDYVKSKNIVALKNITNQFLDNASIEEVRFLDGNKNILAEAKEAHVGAYKNIKQPIVSEIDKKVLGYIEFSYNLVKVEAVKDEFYRKTIIGVIAAQLFIYLIFYFILKSTTTRLGMVSQKLREISHKNQESSERVKKISEAVSASTHDQAASIQETVSTLDEITSMVNTSVDSAKSSTLKAEESHRIANDGKEVVKEMISSMEEINHSNKDIMDEIQRSNGRIAEIVKVINEISTKTSVINDIVFQTKLLSFNASVEAARAGEHGKGFAVVAEEVGNLARMSGTASNEISQMLSDSINKVNSIIDETNRNIVRLIDAGNQKVSSGVAVADRCGKVLDEVVENATIVKTMMNEVSLACKEQAEGIKNIAMAMNQLDQTTLNNADAANKSFENSKEMAVQADELQYNVTDLENEIFGSKGYVVKAKKEASSIVTKKEFEDKRVGAKTEVKTSVPKDVKAQVKAPVKLEAKVDKLPVRPVEKTVPKKEVKKETALNNVVDIKKKAPAPAVAPAAKSVGKKVSGGLGIDVPLADDSRFEDV